MLSSSVVSVEAMNDMKQILEMNNILFVPGTFQVETLMAREQRERREMLAEAESQRREILASAEIQRREIQAEAHSARNARILSLPSTETRRSITQSDQKSIEYKPNND